MILITNGIEKFQVTKGAFKEIFEPMGYEITDEAEIADLSPENEARGINTQPLEDSEESGQILHSENSSEEDESEDDLEDDDEDELDETPLTDMTKAQLRTYAEANGIDLEGVADRKDDLIEAIKSASNN